MLVANLTHAYILEARHYCLLRTLEKLDTPTILWMSLVLTKRIGTNYQKKLVLYGYLLSVDDLSSKATRRKESEIFLLSHMHVSYKNKYLFLSRKQALTFSLKARVVTIAVLALSFYPRINAPAIRCHMELE